MEEYIHEKGPGNPYPSLTILTQTSFAFEASEFESITPSPVDIVEAIDEKYNYPVLPGTDEWIAVGDTRTRHDACEIPVEILNKLTTKALLLTALDIPSIPIYPHLKMLNQDLITL